jgi:biopolymer transport protein ExbB/TolQ
MLILAAIDLVTYFLASPTTRHRNFKGEIVGLGILGTFWGIFVGLQDFDPAQIQSSIPSLLDGLKTAFLTSISGMSISMVLTVAQAMIDRRAAHGAEDPVQAAMQDLVAFADKAAKETAASQSAVLEQLRNGRMEQRDEALKLRQVFEASFAAMNTSLEAALQKLSEGASKEIIKALEDVIRDFNNKLTEQFGKNFQELNQACLKLVQWQENYRSHIETTEATLRQATEAIAETAAKLGLIAERNQEFERVCQQLGNLLSSSDIHTQALAQHLERQRELFQSVETGLAQVNVGMSDLKARFTVVLEGASAQIETSDHAFQGAITAIVEGFQRLERENGRAFDSVVSQAQASKQSIDELTTRIQGSLTTQTEVVTELTKKSKEMSEQTRAELAASLSQLNAALTSLTREFTGTYQRFLQRVEELMPS